jgi:hypothetical protein
LLVSKIVAVCYKEDTSYVLRGKQLSVCSLYVLYGSGKILRH